MKIIFCCIKDEQRYLKEWIEWHLTLGFDAIHLIEDYGSSSHKDITDLYSNVMLETMESIGVPIYAGHRLHQAFLYALNKYSETDNWIAFVDVDEFIHFEEGYTLDMLCQEFKEHSGVTLYWKYYGSNGYIKRPEGNVLDLYHDDYLPDFYGNILREYKTIVNMNHDNQILLNVHLCMGSVKTNGLYVNVHERSNGNDRVYVKAWIDHYAFKSFEDFCYSLKRGNIAPGKRRLQMYFDAHLQYNDILTPEMQEIYSRIVETLS